MKKTILLCSLIVSTPCLLQAIVTPKVAAPKIAAPATTTFTSTLDVPYAIKVEHTGKIPITLNGIEISYYTTNPSAPKTFTATSLNVATNPPSSDISFRLKPTITSKTEAISATALGISSITINGSAISLTPPWNGLNSDKIYVKTKNGKIALDNAATKKAATALANQSTPAPTIPPAVPTAKAVPVATSTPAIAPIPAAPKDIPATPAAKGFSAPTPPVPVAKAVATTMIKAKTKKPTTPKSPKTSRASKATTKALKAVKAVAP